MNRNIRSIIRISVLTLSILVLPSISFAVDYNTQHTNLNIVKKANDSLLSSASLADTNKNSIILERKSAMLSLAKENPQLFLMSALSSDKKLFSLYGATNNNIEKEKTLTGQVTVIVGDDFVNNIETYNYILTNGTERYDFYPVGQINFKSGDSITVKGYVLDRVLVSDTKDIHRSESKLASDLPVVLESIGNQRLLVILVKNYASDPALFTTAEAKKLVFDGPFTKFMTEQSNGKVSFSGDVVGWDTLNRDYKIIDNGNCYFLFEEDLTRVVNTYNIDLNKYDRIVYLHSGSTLNGGCSSVGKWGKMVNDVIYQLSETMVDVKDYNSSSAWGAQPFKWTNLDSLLSHEIGHALGAEHAMGLSCIKNSTDGDCVDIEYGNEFDTMGRGLNSLHFNALIKEQLGWLDPSQVLTVNKSGVYDISPQENGSKTRLIKIGSQYVSSYFVEMRAPVSFDSKLSNPDLVSNTSGLFINSINTNKYSTKSSLIDMSPMGNTTHSGYVWTESIKKVTLNHPSTNSSSEKLYDPEAGITIGPVVGVDKRADSSLSSIKFNVTFDNAPCKRSAPKAVQKWGIPDTFLAGDYFSPNYWIKNTDNASCGGSTFVIAPIDVPQGWTISLIYPGAAMSINPGVEDTATVLFSIPEDEYTGDYHFKVEVKNSASGLSTIVDSVFHVEGRPAPIVPSVWKAPETAKIGSSVPFVLNFTGGPTFENQVIFLNFFDEDGTFKFTNEINPKVPTTQWSGATSVPGYLNIPGDVTSGTYKVTVGLYPTGQSRQLSSPYETWIGTIDLVSNSEKVAEFKDPNFIINNKTRNNTVPVNSSTVTPIPVTILPWRGPATALANSAITYDLVFRGGPTKSTDKVFVHFVDNSGNIKFVSDITPTIPTTKWTGVLTVPVTVQVPNDVLSGNYKVLAGLYNGSSLIPLNPGPGVVQFGTNKYVVGTLAVSRPSTGTTGASLQSTANTTAVINSAGKVNNSGKKVETRGTSSGSSSYVASPSPTASPTSTPTPSPSPVYSPVSNPSSTKAPTPTSTAMPASTPTPVSTPSSTPTPTQAPVVAPAPAPIPSPVPSPAPSPVASPVASPSVSAARE
jgi:hypothetical protein